MIVVVGDTVCVVVGDVVRDVVCVGVALVVGVVVCVLVRVLVWLVVGVVTSQLRNEASEYAVIMSVSRSLDLSPAPKHKQSRPRDRGSSCMLERGYS